MSDRTTGVSRRGFLRTAAGGTAVAAASGTAAAQDGTTTGTPTGTASGGTRPDFGGYLESVSNFEGEVVDERGQDEVTVEVGVDNGGQPFGFGPAAVHVDNGTTVRFEWTGEGGAHNVVAEDETFNSGDPVAEAGVNFEYTFEEDGVYNYFCSPHKALEMKGGIVVGDDYPTATGPFPGTGGGGGTATTGGGGTEGGGGGGGGGAAGQPDLDGYLDGVGNYGGSVTSMRGQSEATVEVGVDNDGQPYGFGPAAVWVDTGTTVKWEWTGEGGAHNVVAEDETFDSGSAVASAGVNFEYTFEESGVYPYFCSPHKSLNMKGVIVVGDDVPTVAPASGGGGGGSVFPNSAKTIGVATSFVMAATLGLAYFFMRFGGDYDTPE